VIGPDFDEEFEGVIDVHFQIFINLLLGVSCYTKFAKDSHEMTFSTAADVTTNDAETWDREREKLKLSPVL